MFGERNPETAKSFLTPSQLAYLNSLRLITYAVGVVIASQLSERFGHRIVFLLMNSICVSRVAISYTSTSYEQILARRTILQTHIGMEAALVPMYMAELVPSAIRGRMVASFTYHSNSDVDIFANLVSSIITNFTSKYPDRSSWRVPFAIIFAFPALALLLSVFLPESPRWLVGKGKSEEAKNALWYLNSARLSKARLSRADGATCSRVNIMDSFTATMIKRAVLLLGPITIMTCIERLGRRKTFLGMGSLSASSLLMMGVLGAIQPASDGLKRGIVAVSILFPHAYIASFGFIMQIVPSEISHISLRDKTSMVYWMVSDVAFIYAAKSVCLLVWAYFCYHELTSRSLEEVDELSAEGVSAWRSAKWVSTSKMGQLTAMENSKGDAGPMLSEKVVDQDAESARHVENGVDKN
ncbi:hypothetical protein MCOR09_006715 [Pyricularia oryzae]|nr:hypothetical protein MCOR09_006715 [Pyricularia oryzae]